MAVPRRRVRQLRRRTAPRDPAAVERPAPSTWTQIRAVGDITGDGHPDLVLRAGMEFWTLSGYTGGTSGRPR
ncbi:FG-GAP repeat protein [Streptomyces thermocarboxydus]